MFKAASNFYREIKDCLRLFSKESANARRIAFYSESDIYFQYYEGIIDELLARGGEDMEIAYITSDINDTIFRRAENKEKYGRLKVFYVNCLLSVAMIYFDSKVFVMTMPDLGNFHIKRSINPVHYVYAFHAIGSTHLQYRRGAFDHYDAVFCVGPHQVAELKKAEEIYGTKPKTLVECGYHRLEKIWLDHRRMEEAGTLSGPGGVKTVMIAPTWSPGNILDSCVYRIIDELRGDARLSVVIRPHPEYIKRFPDRVSKIRDYINGTGGAADFSLELNMLCDENLHRADVLITDWSGIYLEYAPGTERPALFINTPCRIDNPDYEKIGIPPLELTLRPLCGKVLEPEEIPSIRAAIDDLIDNREKYREEIVKIREKYLFNFPGSAKVAADYILKKVKEA